jgi:hypothetical protein
MCLGWRVEGVNERVRERTDLWWVHGGFVWRGGVAGGLVAVVVVECLDEQEFNVG